MQNARSMAYGMYALGSGSSAGVSISCPSSAPVPDMSRKEPSKHGEFPLVDRHLVEPEITRDEVVRGRKMIAAPSDPPHADQHSLLTTVVQLNSNPAYQSSTDLLTRVSEGSNFATDTSLRKKGIDPKTGSRFLEELAFEVVNTQSLTDISERAEELVARGVRRIFAVFVKDGTVGEWSTQKNAFEMLARDAEIEDPALIRPVRVRAILELAEAEKEIAYTLLVKKNPVLEQYGQAKHKEGRKEGRKEGIRQARAQAVMDILEERFGVVPPTFNERVRALDADTLRSLIKHALKVKGLEELF